jgi:predicted TIM-barrel fold metal-dependent hydrolase
MTQLRAIDVHHHWIPSSHMRRIESFLRPGESILRRGADTRSSLLRNGEDIMNTDEACIGNPEVHLVDMTAAGVDAAVFQLGIWLEWLDLGSAREANDEMAEIQRNSGGRIIGLAHVPPLIKGAEQELERAIVDLGLRGVNLTTHWQGTYPDEAPFRPFFRKVAELGVPVVIHASSCSGICAPLDGDGTHMGRMMDQTVIVTRVMKSSLLDEFPTLRFVMPQLGGAFWAVKRRIRIEDPKSTLGSRVATLDRIWFDTSPPLWAPADIQHAVTNLGARRLVLGTDYPSSRSFLQRGADNVRALQLSDADRHAIMAGNAIGIFNL